ncbi:MAG: PQQ-binding-like beta-propeller repeat protein [Acidobacteria bacterium]|nr:PQQ-binding-like beta-propeller repeat protein [Acidobacteriota bacterium]
MRARVFLSLMSVMGLALAAESPSDPAPALLPMDLRWTSPVPLGATASLVVGDTRLFAVRSSQVTSYAWADGEVLWESPLTVSAPPVAAEGHVFLVGEDRLESLSEVSGYVEWRLPTGPVTIAPTVHAGWVMVTNADGLLRAVSAADGRVVWTTQLPVALAAPLTIDANLVVAAFQDGTVTAWRITDGVVQWSRILGTRPDQVLAAHGRVYLTDDDRRLVSLRQRDGHQEWAYPVGVPSVGRLTVDADHIYLATIDNSVRIYNRNGHQHRRMALAFRIVDGMVADGQRLFVPQSNGEIRIYLADGTRAGRLLPPSPNAIVLNGLVRSGTGPHLRMAMTLSEDSTLTISTYSRSGLTATAAVSAPATLLPPQTWPPRPPGRH